MTKGHIHYPQPIEPLLASAVVPDNEPKRLKFRVWLEAGQTPRFIFPNGPYESRAAVVTINKTYKDEFKSDVGSSENQPRAHFEGGRAFPHIRISEIAIHGPVTKAPASVEEAVPFSAKTASRRPRRSIN